MVIAFELGQRLGVRLTASDLIYILCHDAHEAWTADIPSPVKKDLEKLFPFDFVVPWFIDIPIPINSNVRLIIQLADKIEAYTFIRVHGVGFQAQKISAGCRESVENLLSSLQDNMGMKSAVEVRAAVDSVINDILNETGRGWSWNSETAT